MNNHRQLINLELPPPAHSISGLYNYTAILITLEEKGDLPNSCNLFLRICTGPTVIPEMHIQILVIQAHSEQLLSVGILQPILVMARNVREGSPTYTKSQSPACDRNTSARLSMSLKIVVRLSKPGSEAGLLTSFQPV